MGHEGTTNPADRSAGFLTDSSGPLHRRLSCFPNDPGPPILPTAQKMVAITLTLHIILSRCASRAAWGTAIHSGFNILLAALCVAKLAPGTHIFLILSPFCGIDRDPSRWSELFVK